MKMHVLDKLLKSSVEKGDLQGVAAIISNENQDLYAAGFGISGPGRSQTMTTDTVLWIASMTKAVTAVAAMQLVERGLLKLDEPAFTLLPELKNIQVLQGFDETGAPRLRRPKSYITLRNLMTHTAGFGYDVWHQQIKDFVEAKNIISRSSGSRAALMTPLMFDPGTDWAYSISIAVSYTHLTLPTKRIV